MWAFNEEIVARALARSAIPTISAVGHEIDFTIADFVADLRAPTPSAAAELVVKAKQEFVNLLDQSRTRLQQDLRWRLAEIRERLSALASNYVLRRPAELVRQYNQQVDDLQHRLGQAARQAGQQRRARLETASEKFKLLSPHARVAGWTQRLGADRQRLAVALARGWQQTGHRFEQARGRLELLSPKSVLQRGYSITRFAGTGQIVRRVGDVTAGIPLLTMVLDGEFGSVVSSTAVTESPARDEFPAGRGHEK